MFASVKIPAALCGADDCTGCQSVQVNEPNPILLELRGEESIDLPGEIPYLVTGSRYWADMTPEQIDHARKVLTRLANLSQIGA